MNLKTVISLVRNFHVIFVKLQLKIHGKLGMQLKWFSNHSNIQERSIEKQWRFELVFVCCLQQKLVRFHEKISHGPSTDSMCCCVLLLNENFRVLVVGVAKTNFHFLIEKETLGQNDRGACVSMEDFSWFFPFHVKKARNSPFD